ncbi:SICAvar, type I [Plasmodium knowlesi strain H]|uniref:SICAvar, type I n=1 Tax=Plasmodium knowlesi (strain H) TaxID=5851 RepID=A0A1A7W4E9_PLAKH|nr:SICAvar, type I [Plasmodium knowlesi strain H]
MRGKERVLRAVACIQNYKNQDDKMCDRLQCIVNYLKTRDEATPAASPSPTENFWKDSGGEVANLWKELADKMKENKGTGESECDGMQNPSDKAACNYLHAGFTELYNPAAGTSSSATSPTGGTILSKDNPSFRQTMGCFLLHAYAKHMKEKATCLIDDGIQKAFQLGEKMSESNTNCTGNGKTCIPCKWKENDKEWEDCPITASGGNASGGTVKDKLGTIIDKDNDPHIKEMAKQVNKVDSLCDQFKCVANRWIKQDGNSRNWSDVWDEVTDQLKDLSGKIEEKKKDKEVYKHCSTLNDKTGKEACLLMAAGLKDLYDIRDNDNADGKDDLVEASFQRTMYCALLNAIADRLLTLPCKDEKSVQAGINEAFNRKNDEIMQGSKGCKTDNASCFKCDRFNDYRTCEFKENDSNQVLLHTKIDSKLNEYDSTTATSTSTGSTTTTTTTTTSPLSKKSLITTIWMSKKNDDLTLNQYCKDVGSKSNDTPGEITAKQKACKLFASGLKHISDIKSDNNQAHDVPLRKTMMCAALNLYADQLTNEAKNQCPLDNEKLNDAIQHAFDNSTTIMNGGTSCSAGSGTSSCFICERQKTFPPCKIGSDEIKKKMTDLLDNEDKSNTASNNNQEKTLEKINEIETFCTQVQCAIKQHYRAKNGRTIANGKTPSWENIKSDATKELTALLKDMNDPTKQSAAEQYCSDKDAKWDALGHKKSKTNKAACLLFAAGLKHIYTYGNDQKKGPSFEQTMGCLFLKEYAKQLEKMANKKKKGNSWVHPYCDIDKGIKHAFGKSEKIMEETSQCKKNGNNSCFVCIQNQGYDDCNIGTDSVKDNVGTIFQDDQKQKHMQQTLENTVCPILLTDLLTPFLPLAPVSIGLSAMAYYLWKYFGPLGKEGARFRRSPVEIPGPSVQEQVLDHVEEAGPHEYRLVKERKPRSAPTRTKRSGPVNRRTIIEIHFEVLDECQKGDTQLNQKDFLELLVQEFMGSELMEEEQVPKEDVLMEAVPMERVPNLGSGFMV